MQIVCLQLSDQQRFDNLPEVAMDCHLARSSEDLYLVIGARVGIILNEALAEPNEDFFSQPWLSADLSAEERLRRFDNWLENLDGAPSLSAVTAAQAWPSLWNAFSKVTPKIPLPPPQAPPISTYGHLPFSTRTDSKTIIYRWEAFPTSRRIDQTAKTIAVDTYAAPASEVPFAPTGFAAVARFALPNLMPACFRWELQPVARSVLECGASVPLYGQSGGGVEVKFVRKTGNRCAIADPVMLPAL